MYSALAHDKLCKKPKGVGSNITTYADMYYNKEPPAVDSLRVRLSSKYC